MKTLLESSARFDRLQPREKLFLVVNWCNYWLNLAGQSVASVWENYDQLAGQKQSPGGFNVARTARNCRENDQ